MSNNVCKTPRWRMLKASLNNLDATAFRKKAIEEDVIVLDVRTAQEYATGSIEGAIHINYFEEQFLEKLEMLDSSKDILVYCRSGRRSIRVCTLMKNGAFNADKIYNLEGGLLEWLSQYPVNTQ